MDDVRSLAQRMADEVRDRPLLAGAETVPLSVTIGLAEFAPGMSLDALVRIADARLYEGKRRRTGDREKEGAPRPLAV